MQAGFPRARGCLLGQLAGDPLGGLVEFRGPGEIRRQDPNGVRDLADGGNGNPFVGQPTENFEIALSPARVLTEHGRCDPVKAGKAGLFR